MRSLMKMQNVMKYKISTDVLNETTKCTGDFSCLNGMTDCICEVNTNINNRIIFINPCDNKSCKYMLSFGYKYICTCPTRMEIFSSYNF